MDSVHASPESNGSMALTTKRRIPRRFLALRDRRALRALGRFSRRFFQDKEGLREVVLVVFLSVAPADPTAQEAQLAEVLEVDQPVVMGPMVVD